MGEADPLPPKPINLLRGWPNPALLPTALINAAGKKALSNPRISTPGLLYGPDAGYQPLREEIGVWLQKFYSPSLLPKGELVTEMGRETLGDRICITGGASQNLACILQVFSDPLYTKRVWMVAPCYYLACRIFADAALKMSAVEEGDEGIDLLALERGMKEVESETKDVPLKTPTPWSKKYAHIIYCVPTFSNPSGKSMSRSHRQALVILARKYNALIIADDVYDFLQWKNFPCPCSYGWAPLKSALLPRLVDIDRTLSPTPAPEDFGNTVSNGSFSKIVGPGVRTGWAEASPKFIYGLSQCGSSKSGGAPSQAMATVMHELVKGGKLNRHIRMVLIPAYEKRWRWMMSAIASILMPLGVNVQKQSGESGERAGGYFLWLALPQGVSASEVSEIAKRQEELIVAPGGLFEVMGDETVKLDGYVRVCFAWEGEKGSDGSWVGMRELQDGILRLGRVIKGILDRGVGKGKMMGIEMEQTMEIEETAETRETNKRKYDELRKWDFSKCPEP
ncbi:hypothetical protein B7494_g2896 [Chlorociboria aeruginascens]|nr:hypothetical protein B7494_g2896 [Chlorociboria aeruginascens]